jgi:hypothetical protein
VNWADLTQVRFIGGFWCLQCWTFKKPTRNVVAREGEGHLNLQREQFSAYVKRWGNLCHVMILNLTVRQ